MVTNTLNLVCDHQLKWNIHSICRYGRGSITPYMIKFVDVVPLLLQKLPFHSLLRCATEGPEHLHYMHMCLFYQHTPRGGGETHADPILLLFEHMYLSIRWKIASAPTEVQLYFEEYVKKCLDFEQAGPGEQEPQPVVSEV